MASCHRTARKWMLRTTSLMAQFAILSAGCAPIVTAKFPEVYPPPSVKSDATKVGFAPVADSRRDEGAGWNGAGIPVVAGAGLTNYIDHKFRSHMVEEGFAPIDAPDPESGSTFCLQDSSDHASIDQSRKFGNGLRSPDCICRHRCAGLCGGEALDRIRAELQRHSSRERRSGPPTSRSGGLGNR